MSLKKHASPSIGSKSPPCLDTVHTLKNKCTFTGGENIGSEITLMENSKFSARSVSPLPHCFRFYHFEICEIDVENASITSKRGILFLNAII